MRIAILGWGSLLWEGGPEFDDQHQAWQFDGPELTIEFSRVSKRSRLGALTLVIDDQCGSPTTVAWCLSKRQGVEDAICDLRCREGTTVENIGHVRLDEQHALPASPPAARDSIIVWARDKKVDAVIWTALKSNFAEEAELPFSVDAAIAYVKTLSAAGKAKAAEYVWRAPNFVQTPVRTALQQEPWFSRAVTPIPPPTGEEAFRVVKLIRPSFDKYVAMYNERKFPSTVYDQLVGAFGIPQQVTDCDLRKAILWKFGHLIKQEPSIPRSHEVLITVLQREWATLSSNLTGSAWQVFQQLHDAIGGKHRYVTVSFLLHLLRPTEIPIIDQHTFRAMNYYLTIIRDGWKSKAKPSTFGDLVILSGFTSSVLCYWRSIDPTTVPSERGLDRFLMMLGKALKRRKPLAPGRGPSGRETLLRCADPTGNRSIRLPFSGATATFEVGKLIEYLNESGRDYIIQGQTQCALAAHPKPKSLDYWLRLNCTNNHDAKQAVNEVIGQLVSTGLFEEGRFRCPDSGRTCKGIRLAAGADAR